MNVVMSDRTSDHGSGPTRIVLEPTAKTSAETIADFKRAAGEVGVDAVVKALERQNTLLEESIEQQRELNAKQGETNAHLTQIIDGQKKQSKTFQAIEKAVKKGGVFVSEYLPQILLGLGAWLAVYYHEQLLALHYSMTLIWADVQPQITKTVTTIMEWWNAKHR
jgi:hypothetical protein